MLPNVGVGHVVIQFNAPRIGQDAQVKPPVQMIVRPDMYMLVTQTSATVQLTTGLLLVNVWIQHLTAVQRHQLHVLYVPQRHVLMMSQYQLPVQ